MLQVLEREPNMSANALHRQTSAPATLLKLEPSLVRVVRPIAPLAHFAVHLQTRRVRAVAFAVLRDAIWVVLEPLSVAHAENT